MYRVEKWSDKTIINLICVNVRNRKKKKKITHPKTVNIGILSTKRVIFGQQFPMRFQQQQLNYKPAVNAVQFFSRTQAQIPIASIDLTRALCFFHFNSIILYRRQFSNWLLMMAYVPIAHDLAFDWFFFILLCSPITLRIDCGYSIIMNDGWAWFAHTHIQQNCKSWTCDEIR